VTPHTPSPAALDFAPVVLIADDNRLMREFCCEALAGKALRLLTAGDGQAALALAEAWIPDVLITDLAMPRLDGVGLIRALRRLYPHVPVIVMTADAASGGRSIDELAAELGPVAILQKPFDLSLLDEAVRRAVPLLDGGAPRPVPSGRAA
jgi:CheY-like chemotaxis protein